MRIRLSDHFTYGKLIRFTLPSICMMVFTSLYGIVDGFFVSNYAGKTAFAGLNLVMPFIMASVMPGFMLGTGGSAIVAKTLGEGDREKADRYFSMFIYAAAAIGAVITVVCIPNMEHIVHLLGGEGKLAEEAVKYGRISFSTNIFYILQVMFQSFFVTAEKPRMSFVMSVVSGVVNIILDWLLIGVLGFGVEGAAIGTCTGEFLGGLIPLIYFFRKNDSLLRLVKCRFYLRVFGAACFNGISEMISNLSMNVVAIAYNFQLLRFAGEDGVAAYGIIMYVNFVFVSIMIGYAIGSAPVVGYNFGAGNHAEMRNMKTKSIIMMLILGAAMMAAAEVFSRPVVGIFASYDLELWNMTVTGFRTYASAFVIMGVNIWGSSFFTALNNGLISGIISFIRTFIFELANVIILPEILGIRGIWMAMPLAEVMALIVTVIAIKMNQKRYGY